MTRNKLHKLRRELLRLRRSPQKAADLERFAKSVGRKKVRRGKEPTWESTEFNLFPVAIPHHGGKDLTVGTKNNVLDQLEDDLLAWEERLDSEQDENEPGDLDGDHD